jgi:hypothetical protein
MAELVGVGEVYASGKLVGRLRYWIQVHQEFLSDGRGGREPGMKSIEGRVLPADGESPLLLLKLIDFPELRLQLEDGRWWNFFVASSDGRAANRSGSDFTRE